MATPETQVTRPLTASSSTEWTLVIPRRRRHHTHSRKADEPSLLSADRHYLPPGPIPWSPPDSSEADPAAISHHLRKLTASSTKLSSSRFSCRFLSTLRSHPRLRLISSSPRPPHLVVYGIGSVASYETPRLQLSLALLLHKELRLNTPLQLFDPVLTSSECAALRDLGIRVMDIDEGGRREVTGPTVFYMPHCEAVMYDNLLAVNWRPEALRETIVLGNSFKEYEGFVSGMGKGSRVEGQARFVVRASGLVEEIGIDGKERMVEEEEDGEDVFKAFHLTSWHFFDLDCEAARVEFSGG